MKAEFVIKSSSGVEIREIDLVPIPVGKIVVHQDRRRAVWRRMDLIRHGHAACDDIESADNCFRISICNDRFRNLLKQ